jgi:hypothetical protein
MSDQNPNQQAATPSAPVPPTVPAATEPDSAPVSAQDSTGASTPVKNRRSKNMRAMQEDILENPELGSDLNYEQQSLIRYEAITNQEQADQYIRDLGLDDLPEIQDPREKALNLYGFYNFLEIQKDTDSFTDNLIKTFQLAIFFDDNFVYRYLLARLWFIRGDRERAAEQINDCVEKIKSKQTTLYASLAKEINVQVMKNEINALLIKLNLPALTDEA